MYFTCVQLHAYIQSCRHISDDKEPTAQKKTGGYDKRMKSIKEESGAYISQLTAMIDETNAFVDGQFLKYKLCNLIRNKNAHKTKLEIVITHQFYT